MTQDYCQPDSSGRICRFCGWEHSGKGPFPRHVCGTYQPGVGKELKRMFARWGIYPTGSCQCDQRATLMDQEGPDWCERNLATIVRWLRDEAANRSFIQRIAARIPLLIPRIVRRAIRRTRRKLEKLQRCSGPMV